MLIYICLKGCAHFLASPSPTNLSYFGFAEVSQSVFGNFKCLVLFAGLTLLSASSSSSPSSSASMFFLYTSVT